MNKTILIEAPSNLGLKEPSQGVEPGVKFFPSAMNKLGFAEMAGIKEKVSVIPPAYSTEIDEESKVRNADKIIDYSKQLANVTGNGHGKLTNIEHLKPYIEEENVFCFGNRDLTEDWYVNAIMKSNVHYFDLHVLRRKGITAVTNEFLQMIAGKQLDGFWIHLDADVLNDEIMPCVDSRQEDGLSYNELKLTLQSLISSPLFYGIDVTIFDPTLDKEGRYIKQFAGELANVLKNKFSN